MSIQSKTIQSPLFVVSNREPYMHVNRGKGIEMIVPASGLVTALEPILRACDGKWIAAGSGDADRETVDENDHLRVPPEGPEYTLRRVWLTKEEEEGYYYGFSNEGLWPLCHIAHTRPLFRASDWQCYQDANRKFADAVLEEMAGAEHPLVLVQDYHFALLPRMIKEARPDARIAIFWHIPWPNAEAFGICPWQRELLDGLLGADLVGFHIQAHCNNFLETVDRALESRIEWERFAVKRHEQTTLVRPFPISVDFREGRAEPKVAESPYVVRTALLKNQGLEASFLGIGVDRIDYTKGILERFRGIERFLEKWPSYQRQFTFVQIGAPSRTRIQRYHDFVAEVEAEAARINARFQTPKWKPIVLLKRHHEHGEIQPYYQAADLCMVTSLHDGMNLVAKEFVAAREDEEGALILSQFTGASRELRDAIIVNPYDIEQLSEAIHTALEMSAPERHARMQRLRRTVREHNVYRWAGNLITELSEIRVEDGEDQHFSLDEPAKKNGRASGLAIVSEQSSVRRKRLRRIGILDERRQDASAAGRRTRKKSRGARSLFHAWPEVIARLRKAESRALLLDFDGTLARLQPRPDDVLLAERARRILRRLAMSKDLFVAVVSGRRLGTLQTMIGVEGIHHVGLHGSERAGKSTILGKRSRQDLLRAKRDARSKMDALPGVWIEEKGLSFAVHYRGARPAIALAADLILREILAPTRDTLRIL